MFWGWGVPPGEGRPVRRGGQCRLADHWSGGRLHTVTDGAPLSRRAHHRTVQWRFGAVRMGSPRIWRASLRAAPPTTRRGRPSAPQPAPAPATSPLASLPAPGPKLSSSALRRAPGAPPATARHLFVVLRSRARAAGARRSPALPAQSAAPQQLKSSPSKGYLTNGADTSKWHVFQVDSTYRCGTLLFRRLLTGELFEFARVAKLSA